MQAQLSVQPLADFIRSRIIAGGPVTVAQFMEWALYHPQYGYYMTGPNIGPRGDFTTSPEASPAFGRLLARHVAEVDALLDHPTAFSIIECGPGRGTLAKQILDTLKSQYPSLYERSIYWLIEISPALRAAQIELLSSEHEATCRWAGAVEDVPDNVEGAVLANEFIDAFPVHVLENRDGSLMEQYVDVGVDLDNEGGEGFKIILAEPSDPDLPKFVQHYGIELKPGERIEVNLAMGDWFASLSRKLMRGVAVIIDYGDMSPGRYSEARRQGTLLGYFGGSVTYDITANPGKQDLTALVDFTALKDAAEEAGLEQIALTRQAHFLLGLGLGTTETVEGSHNNPHDVAGLLEYRRGLQALVSMEGLGRFHVSVLQKGLDSAQVRQGLSGLEYADFR